MDYAPSQPAYTGRDSGKPDSVVNLYRTYTAGLQGWLT